MLLRLGLGGCHSFHSALGTPLERGGAVFIGEDNSGGLGVRLKFNAKDVRAINRMEGEGGPVGTDDV